MAGGRPLSQTPRSTTSTGTRQATTHRQQNPPAHGHNRPRAPCREPTGSRCMRPDLGSDCWQRPASARRHPTTDRLSPGARFTPKWRGAPNITALEDGSERRSLTSLTPRLDVNLMPFLGRAGPRRSLIASRIAASAGTDSRDVLCAVSEIGARSRMVLEAARLAIDTVSRDRDRRSAFRFATAEQHEPPSVSRLPRLVDCERVAGSKPAPPSGRRRKLADPESRRDCDERFLGERSSGRGRRRDGIAPVGR
jgi:hypothetical protein